MKYPILSSSSESKMAMYEKRFSNLKNKFPEGGGANSEGGRSIEEIRYSSIF